MRYKSIPHDVNLEDINIKETEYSEQLNELFIRNGLESQPETETATDLLKTWEARYGDKLVGGAVLGFREGEFILDGIAVEDDFRGKNLGKRLLNKVLEEVGERGGKTLYLVARAPDFYRKAGFETVTRDEAPTFFECGSCSQYQVSCFPELMRFIL